MVPVVVPACGSPLYICIYSWPFPARFCKCGILGPFMQLVAKQANRFEGNAGTGAMAADVTEALGALNRR